MEYLKIAQDLEMYGVSYFAITVSVNYFVQYFEKCVLEHNYHADLKYLLNASH